MPIKNFFIPQVQDEEEKKEVVEESPKKQKYQTEEFVSSIYGTKVKNTDYIPSVDRGNNAKQYDSFRSDKRNTMTDFDDYIYSNKNNNNYNNNPQVNNNYQNRQNLENNISNSNNNYNYNNTQPQENNNSNNYNYNNTQPQENNNSNYNYNNNYNDQSQENNSNNSNYYTQEVDNNYQENNVVVEEKPNNDYGKQIDAIYEDTPKQQVKQSSKEVKFEDKKVKTKYVAPPLNILSRKPEKNNDDLVNTNKQKDIIDLTLKQFGIGGHVVDFTKGPTVTLFEVKLDDGVLNQKINPIQSNLQSNLHATSIRLQVPIPGKGTIGVEVPNIERENVYFGDLVSNTDYLNDGNPLNVVLGVNLSGDNVYLNIADMPHGLVGGTTGSGKSVCMNSIICSFLYKAHPDDVKLILIDPKQVEFAAYSHIPHLATPIITEPKMANLALQWVVDEMENRYELLRTCNVRDYQDYLREEVNDVRLKHIPYIVIIIDELADLMMTAGAEVEASIMRIAQKARACGIHLIMATQRPAANIISGNIKANIETRISFKVKTTIDSNIILDRAGAEKLLGHGDMLYNGKNMLERIQGAYIDSKEIRNAVSYIDHIEPHYLFTEEDLRKKTLVDHSNDALDDELFQDIARYVVETNNASINTLQRKFSCGFSRIQAIIIKLGELGVVSENLGSRAREVLVNMAQLEDILRRVYGD